LLELLNGGNLREYLTKNNPPLSEKKLSFIAKEVLQGIRVLQEVNKNILKLKIINRNNDLIKKKLVHYDLHPGNLLLVGRELEEGIKISDFGISKMYSLFIVLFYN
jgi:serine/threonine protein kinase